MISSDFRLTPPPFSVSWVPVCFLPLFHYPLTQRSIVEHLSQWVYHSPGEFTVLGPELSKNFCQTKTRYLLKEEEP